MPPIPKRRWPRFTLRTLFVVVTVLGIWLFPNMKWMMDRHAARQWIGSQAEYWRDLPVSQRTILGAAPPWQLSLLGEKGVERISVVVEKELVVEKRRELERLFPEAEVYVLTPGPGYVGEHARK